MPRLGVPQSQQVAMASQGVAVAMVSGSVLAAALAQAAAPDKDRAAPGLRRWCHERRRRRQRSPGHPLRPAPVHARSSELEL